MSGSIEEIELRTATSADVPALNALIEASVRGLQGNDYTPAEIEGALGHTLGLDSQLIADGTYFVAEAADGRVVGSGGWSYREQERIAIALPNGEEMAVVRMTKSL